MNSRCLFVLAGAAALLSLSACSNSSVVSLDYVPSGQMVRGAPDFAVGHFKDKRGMEPQTLGHVRLPVGPAVDTVQTHLPVSDIVRNAFAHGLESRGMLSQNPRGGRYLLKGEIQDLRAQLLVHPYGYARIRVNVVDTSTDSVIHSRVYEGERQSNAYRPGSGSPVPMLRELTSRALQEAVDRALDDPAMRERLGQGGSGGGRPRYSPGML